MDIDSLSAPYEHADIIMRFDAFWISQVVTRKGPSYFWGTPSDESNGSFLDSVIPHDQS